MKVKDIISGNLYYVIYKGQNRQLFGYDRITKDENNIWYQYGSTIYRRESIDNEELCEKIDIFETKEQVITFVKNQLNSLP